MPIIKKKNTKIKESISKSEDIEEFVNSDGGVISGDRNATSDSEIETETEMIDMFASNMAFDMIKTTESTQANCPCILQENKEKEERLNKFAKELYEYFRKTHEKNFTDYFVNQIDNNYVFSKTKYTFNKLQVIEDIDVNVELKSIVNYKTNNHKLYFNIFTKKIHNENTNITLYKNENFIASYSEVAISFDGIHKSIEMIIELIPRLRYVKSLALFTDNKYDEPFGEEYLAGVECSVCLEKTITRTNCAHYLCLQCWSKLKKNKCPICRSSNIFVMDDNDYNDPDFEYDEEDDDDDDDDDEDDEEDENIIGVLRSNNRRIILSRNV